MTITFACPKCGKKLRVADDAAGKKGQCKCGNSLIVPRVSAPKVELLPARQSGERTFDEPAADNSIGAPIGGPLDVREPVDALSSPPAGRPQVASPQQPVYQPPPIVVNVSQHASATAVAIAGSSYSNGWARAALVVAVLSLLISWIPVVSILAGVGLALAILLAAVGFIAALFHSGRGLATAICAVCVSGIAGVLIVVSTAAAVAVSGVGLAAKAASDAAEQARKNAKAQAALPAVRPARVANEVAPGVSKPLAQAKPPASSVPVAATIPFAASPAATEKADADALNKRMKAKLNQARTLINAKVYGAAEKNLKQIISEAPGAPVAADAQKELDAIPAH